MACVSQLLNFIHADPINGPWFQEKDLELQDKMVLKLLVSHPTFTFLVEHIAIVFLPFIIIVVLVVIVIIIPIYFYDCKGWGYQKDLNCTNLCAV